MDTGILLISAVAAAVGVMIATRLQKKKNAALIPAIEAALRERGALTLPALTEAVGLKGFGARGKVVLALGQMVSDGKLETIAAPEGTPQLQKVNFIKYQLRA